MYLRYRLLQAYFSALLLFIENFSCARLYASRYRNTRHDQDLQGIYTLIEEEINQWLEFGGGQFFAE
jgi:hypothetical protein